jgi:hypothetical protein
VAFWRLHCHALHPAAVWSKCQPGMHTELSLQKLFPLALNFPEISLQKSLIAPHLLPMVNKGAGRIKIDCRLNTIKPVCKSLSGFFFLILFEAEGRRG